MSDRATLTFGEDGVAELRLTRAGAHNGIDPGMVEALDAAVSQLPGAARALLICADGPSFTVGGDLAHFAGAAARGELAEALEPMIGPFHATLLQLHELDIPVVCALQGAAAGGGLGLAWVSDIVIAAEDAKLATGFAAIGLSGDGASSWWLPRLVGLTRARELILENRVLDAATACEWGLVTRVVPRDELHAHARTTVERFAAGPPVAYAQMKQLLRRDGTLAEQYLAELEAMRVTGASQDAAQRIIGFAERRGLTVPPQ